MLLETPWTGLVLSQACPLLEGDAYALGLYWNLPGLGDMALQSFLKTVRAPKRLFQHKTSRSTENPIKLMVVKLYDRE